MRADLLAAAALHELKQRDEEREYRYDEADHLHGPLCSTNNVGIVAAAAFRFNAPAAGTYANAMIFPP